MADGTKMAGVKSVRQIDDFALVDDEARIFEFSGSSEVPYLRRSWEGSFFEVLGHQNEEVDLSRDDAGALPLLWGHDAYSQAGNVGVILGVRLEGGRAIVRAQLHPTEDVAMLWDKLKAQTIRNISVGYQPLTVELIKTENDVPTYRVTRWHPFEYSIVSVPADYTVGAGRQDSTLTQFRALAENFGASPTTEAKAMTDQTPAAKADNTPADQAETRAHVPAWERDALSIAAKHPNLTIADANTMIGAARNLEDFKTALLERLATPAVTAPSQVSGGEDLARAAAVAGISDVFERRMGAITAPIPQASVYRSSSLLDIAKVSLRTFAGVRHVDEMTRQEIATRFLLEQSGRSHSTSDFPLLLANSARKRLRMAYDNTPTTYQLWAKRGPSLVDFKEVSAIAMSQLPGFVRKPEGAEIKFGTVGESAEKYALATYARGLKFTREMIINDDLRAFSSALTGFGNSGRRLENELTWAQITSNPTMSDTVALFHSTHGNLAASGGAIDATTLNAGRAAMRNQKPLAVAGETARELNIAPRFLFVGTAYEQLAYQFTSSNYVPAKATDVNEFRQGGRSALEPIVEPLISGNKWYLAADSSAIDTVEYAYFADQEGVVIESMSDFMTDALNIKARLDFATKVLDHRGLYHNPGA